MILERARASALLGIVFLFSGSNYALAQANAPDMSKLTMTFREDFDSLSVSPNGPNTRWIAHTPWNGDFGDSRFADPIMGIFPFTIDNGMLRIEAKKNAAGKWESGLLCSFDANNKGFSQKYGYFEMRAKLPKGPGLWPAFWLVSLIDKSARAGIEIDVLEYYGQFPTDYEVNVNVSYKNPADAVPQGKPQKVYIQEGLLVNQFNTFGVWVDPEWIIFYLNRSEVYRKKTPAEHTRPLGVLVNLAMGPGWPIDKTPNPSIMEVDYVHVYALRDQ